MSLASNSSLQLAFPQTSVGFVCHAFTTNPNGRLRGGYFTVSYSRGGSRGRVQGARTPPPTPLGPWDDLRFSNTTGIPQKKKSMWLIGVEVEQETSAPPPKKILDPSLYSSNISPTMWYRLMLNKQCTTLPNVYCCLFAFKKVFSAILTDFVFAWMTA